MHSALCLTVPSLLGTLLLSSVEKLEAAWPSLCPMPALALSNSLAGLLLILILRDALTLGPLHLCSLPTAKIADTETAHGLLPCLPHFFATTSVPPPPSLHALYTCAHTVVTNFCTDSDSRESPLFCSDFYCQCRNTEMLREQLLPGEC